MAELLSPWEAWLASGMNLGDWLELNPCACDAMCTCDEQAIEED